MENKIESKRRPISWSAISIGFSTIGTVALISVFCFAFYKVSLLGKQLQNNVYVLQQRVEASQAHIGSLQQETKQSFDAVSQSVAQMQQVIGGNKNAWRVMEAQYYAKLADTQLQFQGNVAEAIQLLQAADNEVRGINDPRLDPVRRVLAQDIATLQAMPQVDYTGLYMRLSALNSEVNTLPMLIKPVAGNLPASTVISNEPWWKRGLQQSWQALQKVVVIRYHASGAPPFITPDQQDFLLQNCHAQFEKAMWAILHKQPDVYRSSLQQASAWISRYFVTDAPATKSMLTNLNELQHVDIHPVVPRVTTSLQALSDYLVNINNTH